MFLILGYKSQNKIYKEVFIHKSLNNNKNNERLEFLGDSVLSLIVTEILFSKNKNQKEGFLSKQRAKIVARKHLNMIGKKIIPENKIQSNLKTIPENIFGNTLEALVGAIYIDKGINEAKKFIKKNIYNSSSLEDLLVEDFKTQLLKQAQKTGIKAEYKLEKQEGKDHEKTFFVSLFLRGKKIAEAKGRSKKEAEQRAAQKGINHVFLL